MSPQAYSEPDSARPKAQLGELSVEDGEGRGPPKPWYRRLATGLYEFLHEQSFLIIVGLAVGFAAIYPTLGKKGGPLKTEYSVKYAVVGIIFFIMGMSLKTKELGQALVAWKINLLIQGINLIFIPLLYYGVYRALLTSAMNRALVDGIMVMASLPTTTTTSNVLTSSCHGNTAISMVHAAAGNLLGAFVTPGYLLLFLGSESQIDFFDVLVKIVEQLLVPLIAGQIVHNIAKDRLKPIMPICAKLTKAGLIIIIWQTFCDTFSNDDASDIDTEDLLILISVVVVGYVSMFLMALFVFSRPAFHFARKDQVAAWFCSTHKTVVMGIPLISIMFEDNPQVGLLSIPILIYHPTQTLVGSAGLTRIVKWAEDPAQFKTEQSSLLAHDAVSSDQASADAADAADAHEK